MLTTGRKKLAVLISGRGSNMEAILRASQQADYPAEIAIVIADNVDAKGLETARQAGIAAQAFERKAYTSKTDHEQAVIQAIDNAGADFVVLAGYMRILSKEFVDAYDGRLLNIHPSLLPKYKGLDTHARALDENESHHGCSVHFVNAEMDGGQIIAQESLEVLPDDTADSLAERVLKIEHQLYPLAIAAIAKGDIKLEGDKFVTSNKLLLKSDGSAALLP